MRAIRTLGRVIRALLCAVALLGLTAGTPVALLAIGHALGTYIPARSEVSLDLLLQPDDGGVAYAVLLVAGWICWTMLLASVALEVPAALRGRRRRRVRGLGWSQHLVAVLLSGIALTASVGAAGAVDASATPGVSAPMRVGDAPQAPPAAHSKAAHTGPTHTVAPGETLWSIAEARLGDGTRWTEIADLNTGRSMSDGSPFDADRAVHAGWRLRLPANAVTAAESDTMLGGAGTPTIAAAIEVPGTRTVTVVAGDTLSDIAERELGDADRYPDIARASQQLVQPDGLRLTDPDEIRPGWTLVLPIDPRTVDEPPAAPAPPPEQQPPTDTDAPAQPPTDALDPPAPAPPSANEPSVPETPPAPAPPTAAAPAASAGGHSHADRGPSVLLPASLGLGTLTGAGLLATIAVRRRHQQRARRSGERIALPKLPAYEQRLRSSERPEAMAHADVALRTLASELSSVGRPMPKFTTALVTGTGIELHLVAPEPAVAPFTSADAGRRWTCPRTATLLPATEARALPAPCPALAPIGDSPLGEVLLDLESCGVITVGKDGLETLQALAVALLNAAWGEDQSILLVGIDNLRGFEQPGNPQLTQATLPDALRALTTWQRNCAPALGRESLDSARAARTLYAAPDTWPPSIVLSAEPLDADAVAALARLEGDTPRAAWAVVAPVADGISVPAHWYQLPTGDAQEVTLGGVATQITPHRMGKATHRALLDIVSATGEPPSAPTLPEVHEPDTAVDADEAGPSLTPNVGAEGASTPVSARPSNDSPPTGTPDTGAVHATAEQETHRPESDPADLGEPGADEASARTTETAEAAEPAPGPEVLVLGRVEITGVGSPAERSKRARLTELAALLVLNPGLGHADVDAAMWPDSTTPANRHTAVSKLRRWLGTDSNGEPYLPLIGDAGYRVGPGVACDWHRFQALARRGLRLGPDGIAELTEALTLVRGAPFGGTSPRRYIWAEYLRQEMISAIVDVAARLGELHLAAGDVRSAKLALGKGLEVCPESEMLYRLMFRAAYTSGGPEELDAYVARLTGLLDELGCDMEDDTSLVLRTLLGGR